ncbi:hypothetical protein SBD_0996 [Streptomyces bottropensis ATCC 25435]|uniref:Uncharacterized protein n=1 Tax=Streptomyces bottropensis ATCC 25435 TaxID=1054862 RepID=M3G169_9ACTN|nr:hypothetical protein SBD_0996 [Streptomyces bottropensis ATCC 25435]
MGERVLVPDDVTGWSPGRHVRMVRLGDEDPGEFLLDRGPCGLVELQLVEALQVEGDRVERAVALPSERALAPGGEPPR